RCTESAGKYAAKFRAYSAIATAARLPGTTTACQRSLFVTTSASAEDRIARGAYRAWYPHGTAPLPVLLRTTELISGHSPGVVGPIWRTPSEASGDLVERGYRLPDAANQGRASGPRRACVGQFHLDKCGAQRSEAVASCVRRSAERGVRSVPIEVGQHPPRR